MLGEVLLEPSVIYAPAVRHAVDAALGAVHACAHVTGGGMPGNLARVLPADLDAVIEPESWPVPPIFDEIARVGGVAPDEMARVFNRGVGMVLIVEAGHVDVVRDAVASHGVDSAVIGEIAPGSGSVVER